MRPLLAAALFAFPTLASATSPRVTVAGGDGLIDKPWSLRVSGLKPGRPVDITAQFTSSASSAKLWTARARFIADRRGRVDTARSASIAGTWAGIDPGGLSCSALPVPTDALVAYMKGGGPRLPSYPRLGAFNVAVAVTSGRATTRLNVVRRTTLAGVTRTEIREPGITGAFFTRPGATGIPVMLVSGSGGGIYSEIAGLLASRGHPTLALAYFNYADLPKGLWKVPIERFAEGAGWLAQRTGQPKVVAYGISRGSEAVQLTAAWFPRHIAGIVALVPSPIVHAGIGEGVADGEPAWTIAGKAIAPVPLPTTGYRSAATRQPPGFNGSPMYDAAWRDPDNARAFGIPYDRISVPMIAIGGEDDGLWPSALGARLIAERMAALGKAGLVEVRNYPNAGHSITSPSYGNAMSGTGFHSGLGAWLYRGGTGPGNCRAGFAAWQNVLRFLRRPDVAGVSAR